MTVQPPEAVYLWVCPRGHISNAPVPSRELGLKAVCWTCYPGGRRNNMEPGPAEAERFAYSPTGEAQNGEA